MKRIPRFQVITDEVAQTRFSHLDLAVHAIRGGADGVQFREKRPRTTRDLIRTADAMLAACGDSAVLIVDDRVDVARSLGASAVHLGRDDLDVRTARAVLGPDAVIGGTANSYTEARATWSSGIDYLGVGPIYGTRSKERPAPTMGLETLAAIARDAPVPIVAIGSITAERIAEVIGAGAYGVAVLSAVVCADDPAAAARRCRQALDAALGARA